MLFVLLSQGMSGITMVNLIPGIKPIADHTPPAGMDATRNVFWASMYFTALGEWGRGALSVWCLLVVCRCRVGVCACAHAVQSEGVVYLHQCTSLLWVSGAGASVDGKGARWSVGLCVCAYVLFKL
jgi:hypothetical protein